MRRAMRGDIRHRLYRTAWTGNRDSTAGNVIISMETQKFSGITYSYLPETHKHNNLWIRTELWIFGGECMGLACDIDQNHTSGTLSLSNPRKNH